MLDASQLGCDVLQHRRSIGPSWIVLGNGRGKGTSLSQIPGLPRRLGRPQQHIAFLAKPVQLPSNGPLIKLERSGEVLLKEIRQGGAKKGSIPLAFDGVFQQLASLVRSFGHCNGLSQQKCSDFSLTRSRNLICSLELSDEITSGTLR